MKKRSFLRTLALSLALLTSVPSFAAAKKEFNVCWTIYAGWMPWGTISSEKIIDKWASKYGIKINVVQLNDYIESINQYTAGQFDGCTMTNMDALTIPAAGGVDTTALVLGSYSEGNDGVVLKGERKKLADLKGMKIYLPELSVSHYLLVRGLEKAGLQERDVTVVNTSDADIVSAFATDDVQAAVAWNPQLSTIKATPKTTEVFSSTAVPGELIDMMVVNTETLKDNPALGKALTGAWYEMMGLMKAQDAKALNAMAAASGTDLAGYQAQLKTTHLFYTPADNLAFTTSSDLAKTMQRVAQFSFDKGLLGDGAQSADFIGMAFPGNVTQGDAGNVKLRFDDSFVKLAADGKL
ncbi:putative ABC transporter substrate-binding protein [Pseudescherichia vulneris NBRC 102420]|uniref:Putative ABC transporter substrate-binding protein n=1 Tax=Pseudescherichia vulneris NBRC 102420 TaxID=1115515 RepID=A0A090UVH9_PSEVU|nr:putative urea ABC transporter substrate-binding protein [Pseudescherichia vulneris]GAL56486.1 putative ABC transporter substrate-binding protein [Pseudescherichia vulneris NBRC 102420]STQ61262.1 taurine-binding periplasmic protein precursor [Pseudescherichia vulneris]